jgi:predicted ABC-type ATPase
MPKPIILVFAVPNGSGKITITAQMPYYGMYINADDLKKEYGLTDLEAARKAETLNLCIDLQGGY